MAIPVWNVGQVLTASDVDTWFVPLAASKANTTTRTTTSASLDPELQLTLAPNALYEVHAGILYNCSTGGISFAFPGPSGYQGTYTLGGQLGTANTVSNDWHVGTAANSSTVGALQVMGALQTFSAGGTFGFQWASFSSPVTLSVNQYSFLTARRIG